MRRIESDVEVINFLLSLIHFRLLYILGIEYGNMFDIQNDLRVFIHLDPVETAMLGVWINADDCAFVPAFVVSEFGVEIYL